MTSYWAIGSLALATRITRRTRSTSCSEILGAGGEKTRVCIRVIQWITFGIHWIGRMQTPQKTHHQVSLSINEPL